MVTPVNSIFSPSIHLCLHKMVLQIWWLKKYIYDYILPPTGHLRELNRLHYVTNKKQHNHSRNKIKVAEFKKKKIINVPLHHWHRPTFRGIGLILCKMRILQNTQFNMSFFWGGSKLRWWLGVICSGEGLTNGGLAQRRNILFVRSRDKYLVMHRHFLSVDIFRPDALVVVSLKDV